MIKMNPTTLPDNPQTKNKNYSNSNMNNLSILYINIRSIAKHLNELEVAISNYEKRGIIFPIIALTETWIQDWKKDLYQLKGYKLYLKPAPMGRRAGGVAFYVQESLQCKYSEVYQSELAEFASLKVENTKGPPVEVLLVYRHPNGSKTDFVKELQTVSQMISKRSMLIGDINIDLLSPGTSCKYVNMMSAEGFHSCFQEPTRQKSCLDHVFVRNCNSENVVVKLADFVGGITDHDGLIIRANLTNFKNPLINTNNRIGERIDKKKFQGILERINWSELNIEGEGINEKFQTLEDIICGAKNNATIRRDGIETQHGNKKVKRENRFKTPWANKEVLKVINEKREAYKKYKSDPNSVTKKEVFKLASKIVQRTIRNAKLTYYSELLDSSLQEPRKYWKIVNDIGKWKTTVRENIAEIEIGDEVVTAEESCKRIADHFNDYYIQVTENLLSARGVKQYIDTDEAEDFTEEGESEIKLEEVVLSQKEVKKAINNLKYSNAMGYDGLSNELIKKIPKIVPLLTKLFNKSLKEGIFPDSLKIAIVIPIYKKGDKKIVGNYRPISLLPTIAKIFETCIKNYLVNFLENKGYFSENQFGFRQNKSADLALLSHLTGITEMMEGGNFTMGIYIDLQKAFDTVNHNIMKKILRKAGIAGKLLNWLSSYLKNRKQYVVINGVGSDERLVRHGVPQGSILGPILFNMYINDLLKLNLKGRIMGFADDTALTYGAYSAEQVMEYYNEDITRITEWFMKNGLIVNPSKCSFIQYGFKEWGPNFEKLKLHTTGCSGGECNCPIICRETETKYLGLMLDQKLTWHSQSVYLQNRLRRLNYLFYYLREFFNRGHLLRIYTSLYESTMAYGIMHWGGSSHVKPLEVLQKAVLKTIIQKPKTFESRALFQETGKLSLCNVRKFRSAIFAFKNPDLFGDYRNTKIEEEGGRVTRSAKTRYFKLPGWDKEHSRTQGRYMIPATFNGLQPETRNCLKIGEFKRRMKDEFNR